MLTVLSKNNIALLFIIAAAGISLSILSYQYSTFTANEISKAASQDVRLNARIEAYDLSRILVHSIDSITTNLRALANAPTIQSNETEKAQILFNTAQESTHELTDAYYWINQEGKVIMWSNMNQTTSQHYKGVNLISKEYFIIPKNTHSPYYSSVIESTDNVPRLYISFPIIGNQPKIKNNTAAVSKTGIFKGVIVAGISVSTIGKFLQNELFHEIVSNVGLMDKNGIVLYARNQLLIGKNYLGDGFQSLISPEIKDSYNSILKRSLEGKSGAEDITLRGNTTTISYQPILIDGKQLWTLFIGTPHILASDVGFLIDQQKNFSTLMVIIIGCIALGIAFLILSWNKRLEAAVNTRTAELKEANDSLTKSNKLLATANEQLKVHDKMQKEFINIAAHELRTPIMPILGEAEYIEHQFDHRNKVEVENEQIALIIRNAKRLERLASDILDVSKIESQSLRLNKEQFNLNHVLSDIIVDIQNRLATDKGHNNSVVTILYKPEDIIVEADKGRIIQVISNLLNNAIKFTEEGVISVIAQRKNSQVVVSIKDSGQGIDSEISPRLFSKFTTKSETGTGLGLFISKSIIEAHGGRIWAENNADGKGATFTFSIPRKP
ncbi:MAG: sensor histidine kinase [Nitrososphaeraceae archaeon]|nr:sensor histidine kinase [Nitrososphaeraceae archaeon]MBV9667074.1 sensor histidine kinase [Nitrososphaeraceae archaeon]